MTEFNIFMYLLLTCSTYCIGISSKHNNRGGWDIAQHRRKIEVGRHLWRSSGPSPLLQQEHLEPVVQTHAQLLTVSKDGVSTTLLGNLCPDTLAGKKVFPYVQREPLVCQSAPIASGRVTEHRNHLALPSLQSPFRCLFCYPKYLITAL